MAKDFGGRKSQEGSMKIFKEKIRKKEMIKKVFEKDSIGYIIL